MADYLDRVCQDDSGLRARLQRILDDVQDGSGDSAGPNSRHAKKKPPQPDSRQDTEDRAGGIADRDLRFGMLALQLNLVTRAALVKALHHWLQSRQTPIEQFLHQQGAMSEEVVGLLQVLVDQPVDQDQAEVTASLINLVPAAARRETPGEIPDRELQVALTAVRGDSDTRPAGRTQGQDRSHSSAQRFHVLQFHRSGGMGKVSLAHDQELNREVAFKEVKDRHADDPEYQNRLIIEAEITGGLEHPGIVPVYGLGTDEAGHPFYTMRFVRGRSLGEAISDFREQQNQWSAGQRSLEFRRLLKRFIDVCEAVHYAHHRQVLHRDLKPDNIMLGRYGETLVLDWGLAKALGSHSIPSTDPEATQPLLPHSGDSAAPTTAGTIGTPNYMSPEQARNEDVGRATDIFSLGCTLYRLLCGQPPYVVKEKDRELRKLKTLELARSCQFPMPRAVDKQAPPALEAICLKAMHRDPGQRYPSSRALADDVERWLADEPVTAYRDPWVDRFARWVRRHRTAVVGCSAALITALLASMLLGWIAQSNFVREAQLNTQLNEARQQAEADFATTRQLAFDLIDEAENELSQQPGMEDERRTLTNMALASFAKLYESRSANEPQVQRDLTRLYGYAANLDRFYCDYASAATKYAKALDILRPLTDQDPHDIKSRQRQVETLLDYAAMLLETGQVTTAGDMLQEAEQGVLTLSANSNDTAQVQYLRALLEWLRADESHESGNLPLALQQYQTAASLLGELLPRASLPDMIRALQVLALTGQSRVAWELDRETEAREAADQAVALADRGQNDAAPRHLRHASASASLELARVLEQTTADTELKRHHLQRAEKIWSTLRQQFPDTTNYPQYLAYTQALLAVELLDRREVGEAIKKYQEAQTLVDQLVMKRDSPGVLFTCAQVLELGANHPRLIAPATPGRYRQLAIDQLLTAQIRSQGSTRIEKYLNELRNKDELQSKE